MHIGPLQCPGRVQGHGLFALLCFNILHYHPQTKFGKVICLQVCVCQQGMSGPREVSGSGVSNLRGAWSWGSVWSWGVTGLGGMPGPGGSLVRGVWPQGVAGGDPPGQLLLRALHIILECILVSIFYLNFVKRSRSSRSQCRLKVKVMVNQCQGHIKSKLIFCVCDVYLICARGGTETLPCLFANNKRIQ